MDPIYELQVFGVFWNLSTPLILLSFWSAFFCCFFLFPSLLPYFYNFFISSPPFPSLQNFNFSFHPPHYATIPPPLKPHGRRGPRAAPRAGTPAPSRGAPWRAAARPRRPRRRSTPWLCRSCVLNELFLRFLIIFSQVSYFHNFRKPLFFSGASASFRHAATRAHTLCFPSAQVHRLGGFRGSDFSMKRFRNIVQWSQWISMIPMISMISMILGFLDSCCWCLSRDLFLSLSLSLSLAFSLFLHCTSYEFFCWTSLFDLS